MANVISMQAKKLKDLQIWDYFTLRPILYPSANSVYIRGEYDRAEKKYSVTKWCDINDERMKKGDTIVYTDFIF